MKRIIICCYFFLLLVGASPANAQFRYEFHDKPSPEANVMVVSHSLRQGPSAELYLVGRVFNRGLKPARNVRIVYAIRNSGGRNCRAAPFI